MRPSPAPFLQTAALLCLGLAVTQAVHANPALARKQGCLGCHAVASKLVGPSYVEVAAKYGHDKAAIAELAKSIRTGGSGKWGDMAMPPQAQLSDADARRLAAWILNGAK